MTSEKMKINNLQSDPTVRTTLTDNKKSETKSIGMYVSTGCKWRQMG